MVRVNLVIYSDKKIVLEINLETGSMDLPQINLKTLSKEAILDEIERNYGIIVEDYEVLKEDESSLSIIVGEWEGKLRPLKNTKRLIWSNIRESIDKIEDSSKEILTFFKESYNEIVLDTDKTIGIAHYRECEKYKLTTRGTFLVIRNEKGELMFKREGDKLLSLFTTLQLGESPEEAGYRYLTQELGLLTELKKINLVKDYSENKRVNTHILIGNLDPTLTFLPDMAKNSQFIAFDEVREMYKKGEKLLSEALIRSLEAIEA